MPAFETNYDKEVKKWNAPRSQGGMRPDHPEEFPVMVYRARRPPSGGPYNVINPADEAWSMGNCQTAKNEEERQRFFRSGWAGTPELAIEAANKAEDELAMAAAHRNFEDRNMSELAKREIAAATEEAGMEHVPEVKAKRPYRRRQPAAPKE